jgi:hypothetical protein
MAALVVVKIFTTLARNENTNQRVVTTCKQLDTSQLLSQALHCEILTRSTARRCVPAPLAGVIVTCEAASVIVIIVD